MVRRHWTIIISILFLSSGLPSFGSESAADVKLAKNFTVQWLTVQYSKSVMVSNPDLSKTPEQKSENLSLTCRVEIRDPNLVLGTNQQAIITQLIDDTGRDVAVSTPIGPSHDMYRALRYERTFRHPAPLPAWRATIQRLLGRPPQLPGPPQMVTEFRPSGINAQLDRGLLDRAGEEIRSVKGYFYALVPGSIEYMDVPFEPNNTWIYLTPNLEIQVEEAVRGNTFFRFRINTRPQDGQGERPLTVGQPLPSRFVVARQFIGDDGKPMDAFGGSMWLPAHVGGGGNASGVTGQVKAIRFIIAVDTKEYRIPFELQHIPLPKP